MTPTKGNALVRKLTLEERLKRPRQGRSQFEDLPQWQAAKELIADGLDFGEVVEIVVPESPIARLAVKRCILKYLESTGKDYRVQSFTKTGWGDVFHVINDRRPVRHRRSA